MASEGEWVSAEEEWRLVDPETAVKLLERRGIPLDCPTCGASPSAPFVGEEPRHVAIDQLRSSDDPDPPPEGFKALTVALALTCSRCGAIRLVSLTVLDRFRQEDAET